MEQVPVGIARERNRVLRNMAVEKKRAFMRSLLGTRVEAITLQSGGADFTEALTENYLKVKVEGRHQANRWIHVKAEGVEGEMLIGRAAIGVTPVFVGDPSVASNQGEPGI